MLVPSLALMILCFAPTISHAAQPKAQPYAPKTNRQPLTEEQLEDQIFAKVLRRQACALFTRAGAKVAQTKNHKNFNLQTGRTPCAAK
jgi:hypothetical protein